MDRHAVPELPDAPAPVPGPLRRGSRAAPAPTRTNCSTFPRGTRSRRGVGVSSGTPRPSRRCRERWTATQALRAAGEPLLFRAQEAGVIRSDVELEDVIRLVVSVGRERSGTKHNGSACSGWRSTASE
ncbi:hypothetical protein ABZZ36_29800 [Actinacidiphila glaucinigra]|uniref:SbtR family transcriptional regulator n=1 Tax=Actinacidiphila glaucinigra TaxID=235986 RepID=UPI0033A10F54